MKNEGIYVTGHGSFEAGAVAVGKGSVAVNKTTESPALDTLVQKLDDLIEQLRGEDSLPDQAALVEATERAKEELTRPEPNKFSFLGLLKGIGAGVGSVASLMTSVEAIEHLAVQLL